VIHAIRSEWIKLRTARANVVLIVLAVAVPLGLSLLIAFFGDFEFSDGRDTFAATVLGPCFLCTFLAGVVGVLGIGQEYRHSTIRVTFAAVPRRGRVLGAKIAVTVAFGALIGLVTQLLCLLAASVVLGMDDVHVSLFDPGENLAAFTGQVVLCGLFTLLGFGLGAILRQPAGAIPLLLLWPLIGESIIGGIFPKVGRWLPVSNGLRLAVTGDAGEQTFGRLAAGLYFAAFVAVVVAIGWVLVERRDA
jgi:ABC-2 type transport system permease protein